MIKLIILSSLFVASAVPFTSFTCATEIATPFGGPPSIRLANKASGDISKSEWFGLRAIELHGCVPDARITSLTICIKDCKGKEAALTSTSGVITEAMRDMIANLPAGTPFAVKVTVKDGKSNVWDVPDASFTWRG